MALDITILQRKFAFEEHGLPDPNRELSVMEVRDFYSNTYPELNNASIIGPEIKDGAQVFSFKTNLGSKG